jgi:hypothetical protein
MLAACIIADPPTDLPRPTPRKPSIIRSTADPPTTAILGRFRDANQNQSFNVQVEADPTVTLQWRLFVDYDPVVGGVAASAGSGSKSPDLAAPDAGVREVQMFADGIPAPPDPSRCHIIEGIVALAFNGVDPHAYDPNSGDSIVWVYSPSGDVSGCPIYTTDLDGAFRDVTADGLFVGDGGLE